MKIWNRAVKLPAADRTLSCKRRDKFCHLKGTLPFQYLSPESVLRVEAMDS